MTTKTTDVVQLSQNSTTSQSWHRLDDLARDVATQVHVETSQVPARAGPSLFSQCCFVAPMLVVIGCVLCGRIGASSTGAAVASVYIAPSTTVTTPMKASDGVRSALPTKLLLALGSLVVGLTCV